MLIKKDALSKNVPNEDTCLTGEHCVLYNRKMVKSKNLINGSSVQKLNMERQEVYNLLLEGETSGDMIANNLIAETLDPKSIFVKILKTVKSQNYSPEEEAKCIQDLNKDLKIAHYDFYRLRQEREILNIGLLDTAKDFINIVEWPEIAMNSLSNFLQIKFTYDPDKDLRSLEFNGKGKWLGFNIDDK